MEERGGDFPGQVEERPGRATSGGSGGAWVRIIYDETGGSKRLLRTLAVAVVVPGCPGKRKRLLC